MISNKQVVDEDSALSYYVGTWDSVAGPPEAPVVTGTYTVEWVLGGQFARGTGFLKTADGSNDFEILSLMQFDREAGVYRTWLFFSYGAVTQAAGTSDEATRTMNETTPYGDTIQTTKRCFATDGLERWTLANTGQTGRIVSEMRGRNAPQLMTSTHRGATTASSA